MQFRPRLPGPCLARTRTLRGVWPLGSGRLRYLLGPRTPARLALGLPHRLLHLSELGAEHACEFTRVSRSKRGILDLGNDRCGFTQGGDAPLNTVEVEAGDGLAKRKFCLLYTSRCV